MRNRRGIVLALTTGAVVVALASTAFACVTFMGKVEVEGDDGTTEVVGTGNSHAYCSDGRPTTAAAGHIDDAITIKAMPGKCDDAGAAGDHKLPEGSYEVRYNNRLSYTYDGTFWTMIPASGCFLFANADTTSLIGTFDIDATGFGSWTGALGELNGPTHYATPLTASNICIGDPQGPIGSGGPPGMLAPYQLLAL